MLWAPPEIITSASPRRICRAASPMACVLAAQAVSTLKAGPRTPNSAARWATSHVGFLLHLAVQVHPLEGQFRPAVVSIRPSRQAVHQTAT